MRQILQITVFLLAFILSNIIVSLSLVEIYPTENLKLKDPSHQEIPNPAIEPEYKMTSPNICIDLDVRRRGNVNLPIPKKSKGNKINNRPTGLW